MMAHCALTSSKLAVAALQVNLPSNADFYYIIAQKADNAFVDQLLCIVSSSNPNLGDQYPGV